MRVEGPREKWTVEITVDDDSPRARDFAVLDGAVALELEWSVKPSDEIQVASWEDTLGERGVIILPARLVKGLQKPSGIRAVRDIILNDFRTVLAKEIRTNARHAPQWLVEVASVMHLWKSPTRFIALAHRMRKKSAEPRKVYEMLDAWESRERHLYEYESGARGEAIRERREFYRVLAAQWGKKYKHVLLSDQDLSREARWGEDSDLRFLASPAELRNCLRNVFGKDAIDARWRRTESEKETCESWVSWCLEQWRGGSETVFTSPTERTKNAWAARKAKKKLPGKIGEWSTG